MYAFIKRLYDQHRIQSPRAATRHKMLTARTQISQVFWNMVLCPFTVADIFEENAVSIFSHLLINTASYRRVQPS